MGIREEFEAWWMSGAYGTRKYDRFSEIGLTEDDALEIWEASRAALVIELPSRFAEKYQDYFDDVDGGCFNEGRYIKDLTVAIEAAGLKVKQ